MSPTFPTSTTPSLRRRFDDDDGHVLVLMGLLLAPLLVFAAFATDVGAWVTTGARMQRAADAAALAGASELPNTSNAIDVAEEVMARNGFQTGTDSMTLSISAAPDTGVTVDVSDGDPPMFFAGLVLSSLTIDRRATATSRPSLGLGSPGSGLGNDPQKGNIPNYWLATFGPNNTKANGDRYHAKQCPSTSTPNCSGSPRINDEYSDEGYVFQANVFNPQNGKPLNFQIFDPATVSTGITCDSAFLLTDGSAATNAVIQGDPELAASDPARYEEGPSEWCVGDLQGSSDFQLTVLVRSPDTTPSDDFDNPVICALEVPTDLADSPATETDFLNRLTSNTTRMLPRWTGPGLNADHLNLRFRDYYRNWVEICSITGAVKGEYLIQVRTNADLSNAPSSLVNADASNTTLGYNFYALRTGWGSDPLANSWQWGVSLGARERLPIYINQEPSATSNTVTNFTLVRATKAFAGEQIVIDFYDISDGTGDITLRLRPPTSFSQAGGTMLCDFTKSGVAKAESRECEIKEVSGAGNGQIYQATINLPANYTCDSTKRWDCWIRAKMTFTAQPHDVTTWSAYAPGKPVRLTG